MNDRAATPAPPPAAPPGEVRVSTLVGARLCTGCGFDLCGQPVVREALYRMLMVRCPECATVAALQEYPLRTRWIGRVTGLGVAAWLAALIIAALICAAILNAAGESVAKSMIDSYAIDIARDYDAYFKTTPGFGGAGGLNPWTQGTAPSADSWVDSVWWDGVADQTLAGHGGAFRATRWPPVLRAIFQLPWALVIGAVWSVGLLHVKRRRVLWIAPLLALLGWGMSMMEWGRWGVFFGSNLRPASDLAVAQMGTPARLAAMAILVGGAIAGLWIGRPLARLAVRVLLPPRVWGSLSLLWTEEGLAPPSPVGRATGAPE